MRGMITWLREFLIISLVSLTQLDDWLYEEDGLTSLTSSLLERFWGMVFFLLDRSG